LARREALGKGIGALFSNQETDTETPGSSVITNESEVVSKKPEVITNESEVISKKPEVITNESEVVSKKPEVITNESEVVSKKPEVITNESEVVSKKPEVITPSEKEKERKKSGVRGLKNRQRSPVIKNKQMIETVDQEILEQAIAEGLQSPRISTWSTLVMSTLRYLQLTTARFSMSKEVSETLEAAFKEKYPELFERIEKEIEEM